MSEGLNYPFTAEQIGNQATGNATALILAMTAYAKEHSLSVDEMWRFIGRKFALGWEGMRESPVSEVTKRFALNWVSFGAELRSLSGDETKAQLVFAGWPSAEDLEYFGLTREDFSDGAAVDSIAEYLGLSFEWSRDGDEVTFIFSRPDSA
jgi:hypothetical protein